MRSVSLVALAIVIIASCTAQPAHIQAYIKAPNAAVTSNYKLFGLSMALSGDTLVVGATGEASCSTSIATVAATDNGCTYAGAAYVYTRTGTTWSFQAYIKSPNAEASDYFGASMALSGDTLVVGAKYEDSCSTSIATVAATDNSCSSAGAVYVYTRTGASWSSQAYIKAPNAGAGDNFGNVLALSGDTLVVGATYEGSCSTSIATVAATDNSCSRAGAVYVYTRTGTTWSFQAYIKAPNAAASDHFGYSMALSGDTLVVGTYMEASCSTSIATVAATDNGCTSAGAAYVYTRTGTAWSFQAYIKAPNAATFDGFGISMALSGDTLVVGAISEASCSTSIATVAATDNGCPGAGAAYVYTRTGTAWSFQAYIKAPNAQGAANSNPGDGDNFGSSMALSGDTLVIGAFQEGSCSTSIATVAATDRGTNNECKYSGAAYVYTRTGTAWSFQTYIKASNAQGGASMYSGDEFALSMALSGDTLAVGAHREDSCTTSIVNGAYNQAAVDNGCDAAGAAYAFMLLPGPPAPPPSPTQPPPPFPIQPPPATPPYSCNTLSNFVPIAGGTCDAKCLTSDCFNVDRVAMCPGCDSNARCWPCALASPPPSGTKSLASPPPSGTKSKIYTTNFTLVVAGSVDTFDHEEFRVKLAAALEVPSSLIYFIVSAASVKIDASVQTTSSKVSSDVHARVEEFRADTSSLSSALGVSVESITPPTTWLGTVRSGGSSSTGAIIGGVAGASALAVFAAVAARLYFIKKKKQHKQKRSLPPEAPLPDPTSRVGNTEPVKV